MSVLAVFDVRGIQEFIFRTNKIKEIIGASEIIKNILNDCFKDACDYVFGENAKEVDFEWKHKNGEYYENSVLEVEIIYEGGGNLYAVFKDEKNYRCIYRKMNEKIINDTYSLSVSSICINCTENYIDDINKLMKKLNVIKQKNPPLTLPRGIAVTKRDSNTGLPIVKFIEKSEVNSTQISQKTEQEEQFNSTETTLKLKAYSIYKEKLEKIVKANNTEQTKYIEQKEDKENRENKIYNYMLDLDNMVTDKGTESLLAIVHIDGNNMAEAVSTRMNEFNNYEKAVPKIRELSQIITDSFTNVSYNVMPDMLGKTISKNTNWRDLDINKGCNTPKLPMRPIIIAGDDITFICNARIAIPLTKLYLEEIIKCKDKKNKNMEFSACAGIAFIHSHFPFNLAYKIAEECCSNAKVEAKSVPKDKKRGFIDYHFCFSGVTGDLDSLRENQYINENGYSLLRRPWQVTGEKFDTLKDIRMLEEFAEFFSSGKNSNSNDNSEKVNSQIDNSNNFNINNSIKNLYDSEPKAWPSSRVAEFRNQHFLTEDELIDTIKQYKSRGYDLPKYQKYLNKEVVNESDKDEQIKLFYKDDNTENNSHIDNKAIYYDALEISDIYCTITDFAKEFIDHKLEAQKLEKQMKKEGKSE